MSNHWSQMQLKDVIKNLVRDELKYIMRLTDHVMGPAQVKHLKMLFVVLALIAQRKEII